MSANQTNGTSSNQLVIEQLTVEVKAIKIGRKQMTMGLFRQLPQKSIIDYTGEILGTSVCSINYFWGSCEPNHIHLLWQQGDKIYRDCLYNPSLKPHPVFSDLVSKEKAYWQLEEDLYEDGRQLELQQDMLMEKFLREYPKLEESLKAVEYWDHRIYGPSATPYGAVSHMLYCEFEDAYEQIVSGLEQYFIAV